MTLLQTHRPSPATFIMDTDSSRAPALDAIRRTVRSRVLYTARTAGWNVIATSSPRCSVSRLPTALRVFLMNPTGSGQAFWQIWRTSTTAPLQRNVPRRQTLALARQPQPTCITPLWGDVREQASCHGEENGSPADRNADTMNT